jgi:molybdenum cofactor biosynthesis enzyme
MFLSSAHFIGDSLHDAQVIYAVAISQTTRLIALCHLIKINAPRYNAEIKHRMLDILYLFVGCGLPFIQ